jgi:hypothetical protein
MHFAAYFEQQVVSEWRKAYFDVCFFDLGAPTLPDSRFPETSTSTRGSSSDLCVFLYLLKLLPVVSKSNRLPPNFGISF